MPFNKEINLTNIIANNPIFTTKCEINYFKKFLAYLFDTFIY